MHDKAEFPGPVRDVGLRVQDVLLVVSFTIPVKPFRPVSVTVELPGDPAKIWTGDTALVAIEKSTITKGMAGVEWDRIPSVAVTVTVYVFAIVELQERVTVCWDDPNVTLAGRVQVNPVGVEAETDRVTVPTKPFNAVTVIVDAPDAPASI